MQFDSIFNQMLTKDLNTEVSEMLSKALDSAIAQSKAQRMKARESIERIVNLDDKKIPIEEAALMMGVSVYALKNLIVNEGIPYADTCGYLRNRPGSRLSENHHPKANPAAIGQREMMILTSAIKTPECREIMDVVREISASILLRKFFGL
jgi:hypothetical protein